MLISRRAVIFLAVANPSIPNAGVQRQISLPYSKAVEIAWKSINQRLTRSLLVTSGIVLALAFLTSILISEAVVNGMREWSVGFRQSARYADLRSQQQVMTEQVESRAIAIKAAAERTGTGAAPAVAAAGEPTALLALARAADTDELKKSVGTLPAGTDVMNRLAVSEPALITQWLAAVRGLALVRDELTGPQRLEAQMKAGGIPATPDEIASNKIQTRWLVGLALLVAFVGILNAMLMSVTERFREIGTMKCLGALDSFIIKLFLIESLFQGIVGTAVGLVLGLCLSLVSGGVSFGRFAFLNVPWGQIMGSLGVCLVVGVVLTVAGAVYPAWQAARMQPIEAMRADV